MLNDILFLIIFMGLYISSVIENIRFIKDTNEKIDRLPEEIKILKDEEASPEEFKR